MLYLFSDGTENKVTGSHIIGIIFKFRNLKILRVLSQQTWAGVRRNPQSFGNIKGNEALDPMLYGYWMTHEHELCIYIM